MARDVLITPALGLVDFLDSSVSKASMTLGTDGILTLTGGANPIVFKTSTSGSSILRADGTSGTVFEITDDLSDSLMSVNTIAGLPVFEVFADNRVVAGRYNQNDFYLDTNGNLGLGTSAPSSVLDIYEQSGKDNKLRFHSSTTGSGTSNGSRIGLNGAELFINNIENAAIKIYTQSTQTNGITILGGGNVGIGTTTPGAKLDVQDGQVTIYDSLSTPTYGDGSQERLRVGRDANQSISFQVSDLHNTITAYQDESASETHRFILDRESSTSGIHDFHIARNGSYQVTVDRVGNVGVGTETPSTKLEVVGNNTNALFKSSGTSGVDAGIEIRGGRNGTVDDETSYIHFTNYDDNASPVGVHNLGRIYGSMASAQGRDGTITIEGFDGTNYQHGLTVDETGKVGIGTVSPNHELEVTGGGDATIRITSTSTNISDDARIGTLQYFSSDTTSNTVVGEIVSRTPVGNFGSIFDMAFSTYRLNSGDLSEKMRITGTGNVGIGTASPDSKLHLHEAATAPSLLTLHNSVADILNDGSTGNFIDFKSTDANATFTPQARIGMVVQDQAGDSGIASEGHGNFVVYTAVGTDALGNGTLTEKLRVNHDGKVGIGTISPDSGLNIAKAQTSAHTYTTNHLHLSTPTTVNNGGATTISFATSTVDQYGWSLAAIRQGTSGGDTRFAFKSHGGTDGGNERFSILANGNVGIGTTDPSSHLDIYTTGEMAVMQIGRFDSNPTDAAALDLMEFDGSVGSKTFGVSNAYGFRLKYDGSNNDFMIQSGNSTTVNTRLIIERDTGNVGIGGVTPTLGKLQVDGRGYFGPVGTGDATTKALMDTYSVLKLKPHDSNSTNMTFAQVNSGGGIGIQVTNGTQTADWDIALNPYGGKVGIGTTNPQTKLEIFGGQYTSNYPSMLSVVDDETAFDTDNNGGGISFGAKYTSSSDVRYIAGIQGVKANNTSGNYGGALRFLIRENGTSLLSEKMRVGSTGNVGIGTVTPSQKLHVVGKALITDDVQLTGSNPRIDFNTNGASSLRFYDTTNAAERMRINTSGNLGINTTSPTSKLQVVGSTSGDSVLKVDGTNGTLFEVVDDLSDSLMSVNDAAGLPVFEVFADNHIVAGRYNQNDFYLNTNGSLGLGTSSPIGLLEINSQLSAAATIDYPFVVSSRDDGNLINQLGGEGVGIKFRIAGNSSSTPGNSLVGASIAAIRESSSDTVSNTVLGFFISQDDETLDEAMRIDSSGNVGIGTVTPSQELHVQGNLRLTAAFYDSNNTTGTSGQVLTSTGSATDWKDLDQISTTPNAPASASATIVGETVDVTFTASTTSNIDAYLVYSSIDGSDYGLISVIPPEDFSSSMSVIDNSFDETGTQAYRVYAMKLGVLSSAATASVSYTVSSAEPTSMNVVDLNNAFYVQWNPPSSNERFVTAYNVYKDENASQGSLNRSNATLIYSGLNTNYMYQINGTNNNNFHQFWVETTIA